MNLPLRTYEATQRLRHAVTAHAPATFASSFGVEDMVILDLIATLDLPVDVFTLDTGRLHDETYAFIEAVRLRYGRPIHLYVPDAAAIEPFVAAHGPNAFYRSAELRKQCCELRKVRPLARALAGKTLWITGLRRDQSVTRTDTPILARNDSHGLMKLSPLADWLEDDVSSYIRMHDVPTHPLHQRGFPSIGCAPCTRAVTPGEDPRSGRWWWELAVQRECGIHIDAQGRVVRTNSAVVSN
ncbi:MAG: phosphoadenylyl-sulfate reductase [Betaproteobacteria bacterium]